ncbi:amidohydrolase [Paenibacillus sp. DYY-L-2]|uniref:amidohydrolase n=1 Tax=Paenibacillus sp. DYY-L-2 TaxID=3447013 RepID=UPI003F5021C3
MRKRLMSMLESRKEEMIQIRRHLHENPELSFQEEKTAQYIMEFYKGKDAELQSNVGNGYGIVVTIQGGKPGKTIALRADFDALPILEETELPFKSKNEGVMHACGHDGHTAYMMILADCLIQLKEELPGMVKVIHQHAEEVPPGGAKSIVDSGVLDDVECIFGIHLLPLDPAGVVGVHGGFSMAGRSYMKLGIQGVGGHGSSPHLANDAIVAGAYFVTAVQTIVSRRLNPLEMGVITIGSFDGKGTFNVIKDAVELEGDIRYMTLETKEKIEEEVRRIVSGIEAEFGVKCKLTYTSDYPPLYNDPKVTAAVKTFLEKADDPDIRKVVEYPMMSPSDDFAYYLKKIPGCYFYVGCTPKGIENPYFNHNPRFDIDEDALIVAAKSVGYVVCGYFGL